MEKFKYNFILFKLKKQINQFDNFQYNYIHNDLMTNIVNICINSIKVTI